MKEKLHTIPINEAFASADECPFCWLERETEQRAINYTIGPSASYMEPEIRAVTDAEGFCGHHLKMMHDYGNALGCALILQTYYIGMLQELEQQLEEYELPPKKSLFRRKPVQTEKASLIDWMEKKQGSCFVCNRMKENMQRYFDTFFAMLKDPEFRVSVEQSRGFCMRHFHRLLEEAERSIPNGQRDWFHKTVRSLMWENLIRVKEDIDWFVMKNDYRNAGKDWKTSRDAVSRGIQKLRGGHPSDPVFRSADFGIKTPGR